MQIGEIRYYKGVAVCVVEIVGKGIGNVQVRFLEDFPPWKRGDRIVTRPRLLWRSLLTPSRTPHPRGSGNGSAKRST